MTRHPRAETPIAATAKKLRCAVYTRKSTEEGLDQEYNTLHAQRDACEAYGKRCSATLGVSGFRMGGRTANSTA